MRLKKWSTIGISLVLIASLATGCGKANTGTGTGTVATDNNTKETKETKETNETKTVKLKMWGGVPAEAGPQAVMDSWNAQNKDIQVEYERFVNDDAGNLKLDTALITGQDSDLYVNYALPRLKKRMDSGLALNLSDFKDYDIDANMGADAKLWQINDKYYGMPTTVGKSFVWLNKNALDAAGLPIPPLDWTWEDMQSYAAKLKTDKRWGVLMHEAVYMAQFNSVLATIGTTKPDGTSNLDHPLMKTGFEILYSMMFKDKSTPPYGEQFTAKMPVDTMFLKGESAMLTAGGFIFRNSNNLKDYPRDFKIAFATLPRISKDQKDVKYPGGLGDIISINPNSPNKDAAWKFLKWYADGGMMPMAAGGRIPASKVASTDDATKLLLKGVEDTYDKESLQNVVFGKFPTYVESLEQQVVDLRKEEFEKYFLNKADINTTLSNTVKRHNEFMERNKK